MDFSIMVIDDAGAEKTGGAASTTIKIKREADDFFFDFSDSTFKAIPTTLTSALGETEPTRWAGGYNLEIDVSGFDDGEYDVKMKYDDGVFVRNFIETINLINGVKSDDAIKTLIDAIKSKTDNLPDGVKKNTALANFAFYLVDLSDHVTGKTDVTVTAQRSIDGAAFAACANSVSEVSNGFYKINLAASDLNGNVISFRFTAPNTDTRALTILTQT